MAHTTHETEYSREFLTEELEIALKEVKTGKAPGFDGIYHEFLIRSGNEIRKWLVKFYSTILTKGNLPKVFKITKVIAMLKPSKPPDI